MCSKCQIQWQIECDQNACSKKQMWSYLPNWVTLICFVILGYLYNSRGHTILFKIMRKWSVHWSCYYNLKLQSPQHLILGNPQFSSYTDTVLSNSRCMFKTPLGDFLKFKLCIRSIISDAKKTAMWFCWKPQILKMEASFENKPQGESGLVSVWLILKGRVTNRVWSVYM